MDDTAGNCFGVLFLVGLVGALIVLAVIIIFYITMTCLGAGGISGAATAIWQTFTAYFRTFHDAFTRVSR